MWAIGLSPSEAHLKLDQTVTAGIISALNRSVAILPYEDFLQTDAAINPRQQRWSPGELARGK